MSNFREIYKTWNSFFFNVASTPLNSCPIFYIGWLDLDPEGQIGVNTQNPTKERSGNPVPFHYPIRARSESCMTIYAHKEKSSFSNIFLSKVNEI